MSVVPRVEETDAFAEHEREVVELTRALIRLRSENPPGDERAVAAEAARRLSGLAGVDVRVIDGAPARRAELAAGADSPTDGPAVAGAAPSRPSVIASSGPLGGRTLLLGAHLDTVPAGEGWTRDPFAADLDGDRIYGRGATDNKAAAAAAIVAFQALVRRGATANARLLLVLNADEEIGGRFGMDVVRDELGEPVDAALIAEPSGIAEPYERLWIAARGWLRFQIDVQGTETHTSLMREPGVRSALVDALALIDRLRDGLPMLRRRHPSGYPVGDLILARLDGGRAWGFVPATARAQLELRVTPGVAREDALATVRDAFERARGVTGATATLTLPPDGRDWTAPSAIDADHPLVGAAQAAWRKVLGREPELGCFPGGTDARSLHERGIPAIPGIGPGTLRRAHAPDEYVTAEELTTAVRLYALTARTFLSLDPPTLAARRRRMPAS